MSSSAANSAAAAAAALSGAASALALTGAATVAALSGAATAPAVATEPLASIALAPPATVADLVGSGAAFAAPTAQLPPVPPFLSHLFQGGSASTPVLTRSTGALFSGATPSAPPGSPALRPNYGALAHYAPQPPYPYDAAAYGAFHGAPYGFSYGAPYGVGHAVPYGGPPGAAYGAPYGSGYAAFQGHSPYGAPPPPPVSVAASPASPAVDVAPASAAVVPPPYDFTLDIITTPPFYFSNLLPVKLKMDNYLFWRAQILPLLRSHYLEGFVDGTLPCPSPEHHMYRPWIAQDQAILSAIQSSLTEGVAGMVLFATTSHEVWDALESSFSAQSSSQSMALRTQLNETRKDHHSVTVFFNKIKRLADQLASIREPLRDTEFTAYILQGLDAEYDSLVEVINERAVPIKPQELFQRLLSTEQRLASRRPDEPPSVNAAVRGGKGGARSAAPSSTPPAGGKGAAPPATPAQSRPTIVVENGRPHACCAACGAAAPCQLCGINGHLASRCHRRFKTDFLGLGNNGKGNERQVNMTQQQGKTQSYTVDRSIVISKL